MLKKKALVVKFLLVVEIMGESVMSFSFRDSGSDLDKFRLESPLP